MFKKEKKKEKNKKRQDRKCFLKDTLGIVQAQQQHHQQQHQQQQQPAEQPQPAEEQHVARPTCKAMPKQRVAPQGWRFVLGRHGWSRAVQAITLEGRAEPFEHLMDVAVAASH
eukprot:453916-Amphidinium_carterae.1